MRRIRIYTRKGDTGGTVLMGGRKVGKDSLRVEGYGTVDELNSFVGLAQAAVSNETLMEVLTHTQNELFVLGADLATPMDVTSDSVIRITDQAIERMEKVIDLLEDELPPIRFFILPGGEEGAARLHVCRSICRRAERLVVRLAAMEEINPVAIAYLNRLSDLLFVMARYANHVTGTPETRWTP